MDDALLVGRFERGGDLLRDQQGLVDRNRATRDAMRQVFSFHQFHDQRSDATGFFETVNVRDVGMMIDASSSASR
ncbi:MAG TPA: hypothetical protein VNJ02_09635 [Vicinamibacterales bacterium]|nr:hypothetical protein [Vicinamibacterales bacterium]